ncbi:MAG: laccase domain-containing protein [Planctomycetes bacterium]|nr:laccase domain-containing protein [Planctomycetota bacterium]
MTSRTVALRTTAFVFGTSQRIAHSLSQRTMGRPGEGSVIRSNALPEDVARGNRASLVRGALLDPGKAVLAGQVCGGAVGIISEPHAGAGFREGLPPIEGFDGMVTKTPGIGLVCYSADCPLIGYVDESVPAVGIAHASWRGTMEGIAGNTGQAVLSLSAGRRPLLRVSFAPHIGPCCYEVKQDLIDAVRAKWPNSEAWFVKKGEFTFFDLYQSNRDIMVAAGIPVASIGARPRCSKCAPGLYWSWRAQKEAAGRFGAVIGIRP